MFTALLQLENINKDFEIINKKQMEILRWKNIKIELTSSLEKLNSRLELAKRRICEPVDWQSRRAKEYREEEK